MKKVIVFIVILTIASPLAAQENQQHFLWFCGHWSKVKKNTFITIPCIDSTEGEVIKMSGGSNITVSPKGAVTISSPGSDDWNKKIADGENNLDKTIKEMTAPSNEVQEWTYHFNKVTGSQLDTIKSQWESLKIDKKDDALNPQQQQGNQALQNFGNSLSNWCENIKPEYNAIIDFYNAHRKDKESDYNNPAPPEFEYTCVACDTNSIKENDKEADDYVEKFAKPESDLIRNGVGIIRQLILVNRSNDIDNAPVNVSMDAGMTDKVNQAFHKDKSDPSKSGACAYINSDQLINAVQFLVKRMYNRADKLLRDNQNNVKATMAVMRTYLTVTKQCKLMGFDVDENFPMIASMLKHAFEYYSNKLVNDHDWSQLANIPVMISLYRQYQLVGGQDNDNELSKLFKTLNGFQLTIEMDIKAGKGDGYMIAHLKGKSKITPEFQYGSDSCYQWVLIEDAPNSLGMPVKKGVQKIVADVLDNEIVVPKDRPTYTGTKKYWCMLQKLKMNYCHPGEDTILLSGFTPDPVMGGTWMYPHSPTAVPAGINGMDHYFQDINKMEQMAKSGEAQQQAEKLASQAQSLAAEMKSMQASMGGKHDASQIGNYQQMLNKLNSFQQGANSQSLAPMLDIVFPVQIQNNSTTLFKKRFDAKEMDPKLANVIVYGYYTVDIEYTGGK